MPDQENLKDLLPYLVASSPEQLAHNILDFLSHRTGARNAAVFLPAGRRLRLFAQRTADEDVVKRAQRVWSRGKDALEAGESVVREGTARDTVIVPVRDGDALVAVLYLDGERVAVRLDRWDLSVCSTILASRVTVSSEAGDRDSVTDFLLRSTLDSLLREKLVVDLDQHEGNIALIARRYGKARKTIYNWIERWNIPRRKRRRSRSPGGEPPLGEPVS